MKRAAVLTFGCKVNQYESQALREKLRERGWSVVAPDEGPELVVLNTCTVTEAATAEAAREIRRLRRRLPGAEFTVTGCAADSHREEFLGLPGVRRVVVHDEKSALPLLVEDPRLEAADLRPSIFDLRISAFEGHTRAFLKIQDGCDLDCSFCIIPQVRGRGASRPLEDAVEEAGRLVAAGYRELVLTGVHVGSYGKDLAGRSLLPELARRILELPGLARLRLSSVEAEEVGDGLIDAVAGSGGRFCPHFHVPLQSGDAGVLREMRRRCNPGRFLRTLDRIRERVAGPAFTTDVIAGFPGETDAAFENTLEFCRTAGFGRIHVFTYSHRRGTAASARPDLPAAVKRERRLRLEALGAELAQRQAAAWVGREVEVLVERGGTGYTERYVPAELPGARPNELVRFRPGSAAGGVLRCA